MVSAFEILNASILVVDDQHANVSLLERTLSGAGYASVASTMDPRAVCELHRRNRYNLILLDLQMPGMDGFEVIEALKEIEPDGYLPVLVITAQPSHKLRALQAGARDFISKPFELPEVLMRVRNMLEVRLLHRQVMRHSATVERQSNELRALYDQVVIEQKLSARLRLDLLPDVIVIRPDPEIRHLVPAFLAHRGRDVTALRAALTARDFDAAGALGHTIKETGRGYGFDSITEIGSAIERAAHHRDAEAVETRIAHLSDFLQRVQLKD
jgi:adenylate cyclase